MKEFIKMFFASLLALAVAAFTLFLFFFAIVAIAGAGRSAPAVPADAMLVLDLGAPIPDKPAERSPRDVLSDALTERSVSPLGLRGVTEAIRRAGSDKRIKGIFITGLVGRSGYASGWGALKEIRERLAEFRKGGKKIVAYNLGYDEPTYYIASVADEIVVNPFGMMELNGFASESPFFANAFRKYGVGVQVTRVGKYKSAVEPFLLDRMSDANREQIAKLLGDLWSGYLSDVAEARGLAGGDLQAAADQRGILRPNELQQMKLVDRVAYVDEVIVDLKKLTGADEDERTFRQVSLADYASALALRPERRGDRGVALIYAEGEIVDGDSKTEVGGDYVARLLRKARLDDDVKAVVLRVNSPGGSASASEVIQREVRLLKGKKPVVVSMGTVAASGGYWISSYGDHIFAEPGTITGSIGVFGMFPNVQKLVNDVGVTFDTVKTGQLADMGTIMRPKTDQELAIFQEYVDWIYEQFVDKVVDGRGLPREKVLEIAQGRVWSGVEAKNLGLVDELGGLSAALRHAAGQAKLGDDYGLVVYQEKRSPLADALAALSRDQEEGFAEESVLVRQGRALLDDVRRLALFSDPRGVYARLPFDVTPR